MTCPEDRELDEPENAQQYESRDLAEVDVAAFARSYAAFTQAMYRAADGFGQDLTMATIDTTPVVWFQRGPSPRYGRDV